MRPVLHSVEPKSPAGRKAGSAGGLLRRWRLEEARASGFERQADAAAATRNTSEQPLRLLAKAAEQRRPGG